MALIDDVIITIKAGDGGNGGMSFRTDYGNIKRLPDGGNGGRGGSIYLSGTSNLNDLSEFKFKKEIKGPDGKPGMNKNLDGKKGDDITVLLPLGTTIIDNSTQEAIEILKNDVSVLIASGGRGQRGNHDQTTDIGRIPGETHQAGEKKELHLILNLIADIGLIGLPNAGKSSLLSVLTRATPKIGNYPFTTLEPSLGTLGKIVIADIPGLIEGASMGRGLGIQFLKHIQKTKVLLHCIDATQSDPLTTYQTVRTEFEKYDERLLEKKEIILLTKIDLVQEKELKSQILQLKKIKKEILPVSIYKPERIEKLKKELENSVFHP